ncbi:hypothetical protein BV898_17043 [Hypsibius exemplaris]|uniref:Uncharacterized protein n=1 Tax=Hypsibius exemplaris TaxID=2072580 RepID=A0A9X6RLR8_HYPEX|nr:hypothetical protein BV898_17043 [Hypsibius exemplaris]
MFPRSPHIAIYPPAEFMTVASVSTVIIFHHLSPPILQQRLWRPPFPPSPAFTNPLSSSSLSWLPCFHCLQRFRILILQRKQ